MKDQDKLMFKIWDPAWIVLFFMGVVRNKLEEDLETKMGVEP